VTLKSAATGSEGFERGGFHEMAVRLRVGRVGVRSAGSKALAGFCSLRLDEASLAKLQKSC